MASAWRRAWPWAAGWPEPVMAVPVSQPATAAAGGSLRLAWRPLHVLLPRPLRTARGLLTAKRGWLLRLQAPGGALGWGEAAPLDGDPAPLAAAMAQLGTAVARAGLERVLPGLPPALGFALGAALAELDGLPRRRWLPAPPPALLLPAGEAALEALDAALAAGAAAPGGTSAEPLSCKWKVAVSEDRLERQVLERLLQRLPAGARLRLDANGGWDRATARAWARAAAG